MSDTVKSSVFSLLLPSRVRSKQSKAEAAAERAVTELFEQSRYSLLRYVTSLGVGVDDAEEVIQEVFLLLFQLLQQNKTHANLRGWLFRVAHNLALKKRTSIQTHSERSRHLYSESAHHDPTPSPAERVLAEQHRNRLLAAVEALPEQDRYCLYLRAEGLQYREIAEILEISTGSVSKSLTRAIQRLRSVDRRWRHAL
jgi:RNA polymerase sigma-70 factor (ECF subfamily)